MSLTESQNTIESMFKEFPLLKSIEYIPQMWVATHGVELIARRTILEIQEYLESL